MLPLSCYDKCEPTIYDSFKMNLHPILRCINLYITYYLFLPRCTTQKLYSALPDGYTHRIMYQINV